LLDQIASYGLLNAPVEKTSTQWNLDAKKVSLEPFMYVYLGHQMQALQSQKENYLGTNQRINELPFLSLFVSLSLSLSLSLFLSLSLSLNVCLSLYLDLSLYLYLFISLSLSRSLSLCLSISILTYISSGMYLCMYVCMYGLLVLSFFQGDRCGLQPSHKDHPCHVTGIKVT